MSSLTLLLFDDWPLTTNSLEPETYLSTWLVCPTAPSHPCRCWNHSSHTSPSLLGPGRTVKHLKNSSHTTQLWWQVLIRPTSHEKNCPYWSRVEIWRCWNSNGWKGSCQMLSFGPSNQLVSWTCFHSMAPYTQAIDLLTLLAIIFQIWSYSGWPGISFHMLRVEVKWFSMIWAIQPLTEVANPPRASP